MGAETLFARCAPRIHKKGRVQLIPIQCIQNSPWHKLVGWHFRPESTIVESILWDLSEVVQPPEVVLNPHKMFAIDVRLGLSPTFLWMGQKAFYTTTFPLWICFSAFLWIIWNNIILCKNNIRFHFEGTSHRKVDGVAIGSSLDHILGDEFCQWLRWEWAVHWPRLFYAGDTSIEFRYFKTVVHFSNFIHPHLCLNCRRGEQMLKFFKYRNYGKIGWDTTRVYQQKS